MLDTNILIYLIKNKPESVAQRVNALVEDDELCMSFVTYAELLKGAEGSTRKADVLRRLEGLTRQVPVLYPSGAGLCEHFAEQSVLAHRAHRGQVLPIAFCPLRSTMKHVPSLAHRIPRRRLSRHLPR